MSMQSNYKLKLAVFAALSILANSAVALGFGNIDVKSHLGQPLRATIKIQGVNDIKAAELKGDGCFKLASALQLNGSVQRLPKVRLNLNVTQAKRNCAARCAKRIYTER